MDWKTYYESHITDAAAAVKRIKSGDRVVVGHACAEPSHLVDAMVRNAAAYENVEIVHMVAKGNSEYCAPEYSKNFRHNALFVGASTKAAVAEGRGDFTPCYFSEIPALFQSTLPVDVALVQVTPPNEHGMCSLGVSGRRGKNRDRAGQRVHALYERRKRDRGGGYRLFRAPQRPHHPSGAA